MMLPGHTRDLAPAELEQLVRDLAGRPERWRHLVAYSPPLWRMGAYEVLPTGELRRWSLSYAEELRPIRV
jgi:hypothetical protein